MKTGAVIFMLTLAVTAHAGKLTRPPHMTGDQFIAELRGEPNARRLFDKFYARGYLAGVVDATQGRAWCLPSGLKPELADSLVLDELAKRPVGTMPGIASAVLIEQYSMKFPQHGGVCTFKPRMIGNEFTVWATGHHRKLGAEKMNPSRDVQERERFADGYLGGVVDATQGTN